MNDSALGNVYGGGGDNNYREAVTKCERCGFRCSVGKILRRSRDAGAIDVALECELDNRLRITDTLFLSI